MPPFGCGAVDELASSAEGERKGAVIFGEVMIDEAIRKMATKFVNQGERAGLTRSAG
jgi:citrate lyase subunit beta / citryl-CoA lyase